MTIQYIQPSLIDPNPYQPKSRLNLAPEKFSDLISIGDPDIGLRSVPTVRPHPTKTGRYQRCDGHRRQMAWEYYRPGEAMPNNVEDLTDRQMYDFMAVENGQRQDLTPIEKALIIKGHIDHFGSTQLAAGALVGIKTQGAVSNLLKLLALPASVQPLVNDTQVPQRIARTLVGPARVAPQAVIEIMQAVAAAKDDDKEDVAINELGRVMHKHATEIAWMYLDVKWQPLEPVTIDGQPETPPACIDCDYHVQARGRYCTRKACYTAKLKAFPAAELNRVSLKFDIPIAVPADGAKPLILSYDNETKVKAWLTAKYRPAHLRVMPNPNPTYSTWLTDQLGHHVTLASTEPNILKPKKEQAAQPKPDRATESPAARAKRVAAEEAEAEQRREERSAARRARADVTWLMQQLTLDTAAQLKIEGGLLEIAAQDVAHGTHTPVDWVELADFAKSIHAHKDDQTRKQYIAYKLLLRQIYAYDTAKTFSWSRATSHAEAVVTRDLGLKLLPGWNKPPIHRTPSNCWACGKFTPGSTITSVDRANGWTVSGNDGSVACSNPCRAKLFDAPSPASAGKGRGGGKSKPAKQGTRK